MFAKAKGASVSTLALALAALAAAQATAQPAPAPRLVVPAAEAPEAMGALFDPLAAGEEVVEVPGASWLQLRFGAFELGDGTLTVTAEEGDSQTFDQDQIEAWGGLTAIFNGSRVTVALSEGATAEVAEIVVGLPAPASEETADPALPGPLADLLGPDAARFAAEDEFRAPEGAPEMAPEAEMDVESICGAADDRTASSHPFVGRIMPIGCTGWIIKGGAILTAGHCISSATQTLEFDVPSSRADGTTVSPPVRDQYRIIGDSIVSGYTGVGNDWAVFEVLPNTETGLTAVAAQGGGFRPSNSANPGSVVITGHGVDGPAPGFGRPPPRNADNQTQQTHSGTLTENSIQGTSQARLRYTADTQGGNSGSPVIVSGGGTVTIGIHTNGGCSAGGGANAGTSFRNATLWDAVRAASPGTGSGGAAVAGWMELLLPGG